MVKIFSMIVGQARLHVGKNVIADVEDTLNRHLNVVLCNVDGVGIVQEFSFGMGPRDFFDPGHALPYALDSGVYDIDVNQKSFPLARASLDAPDRGLSWVVYRGTD